MASSQPSQGPDERNTIDVFKEARRGVVHIKVVRQEDGTFGKRTSAEGVGSGFLIGGEGHVLTNYHVIEISNRIEVYLPNERVRVARVVGTAPTLDLALLHVDLLPSDQVKPLWLGDSDTLEVGQKLIAVGHPLALHNTLTVGVLSAEGRSIPGSPIELEGALLQTDAAINPGNSGGPVLSSAGEVIGIATAVAPGAQNLGFAVPINLAKRVIPDLIQMGHPYRPSLGIDGVEITPELADLFGLPRRKGFLVERVVPGSLAERQGIRAGRRVVLMNETAYVLGGDIITEINGKETSSASEIARILLKSHPGEQLRVTLLREGQLREVVLPLAPMHWR
ncbi:MAG: S1C family serine protease [Acidobacteriota bacterium]